MNNGLRCRETAPSEQGSLSSRHTVLKLAAPPMLDTITIKGMWRLRATLPGRRKLILIPGVNGWADTSGTVLERAECSLPKLLHGHNGQVLENQKQLDEALTRMREALNRTAEVPEIAEWRVWRADIAWNYNLKAAPLVFAHAALRLPGIQRGATLYPDGEGVSWRGAKSRFMVTFYDKAKKMRVPGSILRVEISLKGEQLDRRLQGDWWNFKDLYRTYRSIMASIPPIPMPTRAANWQDALGAETPETRQRILARLAHKPKGTFRRYRRMVEAAAAKPPEGFSWGKILPVDGPPPPVNVEPQKRYSGTEP